MTDRAAVEERVRAFLLDGGKIPSDAAGLPADYPLLDTGILDSLGLYSLIVFLEETYGVTIGDDDLLPDNFGTIADVAAMVVGKQ